MEVEEIIQEVVDKFLIPRFMSLGMNATGAWLKSLEVRAEGDKVFILANKYTEQLVFGRKPGKLPPVSELEKWVNAKLGIYGKEAKQMAWAISVKIKQEGTTWYQKGGSDLLEILDEPHVLKFISERVAANHRLEIANELKRYTTKQWSL